MPENIGPRGKGRFTGGGGAQRDSEGVGKMRGMTSFLLVCLCVGANLLSSTCIPGLTTVGTFTNSDGIQHERPPGIRFDPRSGTVQNPFFGMQAVVIESEGRGFCFAGNVKTYRKLMIEERDKLLLAVDSEVPPYQMSRGERFALLALKDFIVKEKHHKAVAQVVDRIFPALIYNAKIRRALSKMPVPKRQWLGLRAPKDLRAVLSEALEEQLENYSSELVDGVRPISSFIPFGDRQAVLRLLLHAEIAAGFASPAIGSKQDMKERVIEGFDNPLEDIAHEKFGSLSFLETELQHKTDFEGRSKVVLDGQRHYPFEHQSAERVNYFIDQYWDQNFEVRRWDRKVLFKVLERAWPQLLYAAQIQEHLMNYPSSYNPLLGGSSYAFDVQKLHALIENQVRGMLKRPARAVPGIKGTKFQKQILELLDTVDLKIQRAKPAMVAEPARLGEIGRQPDKFVEQVSAEFPVRFLEAKPKDEKPFRSPVIISIPKREVGAIDASLSASDHLYQWGTELQGDQLSTTLNVLRFQKAHEEHKSKVREPLVSALQQVVTENVNYSEEVAAQTIPLVMEAMKHSNQQMTQLKEVMESIRSNRDALGIAMESLERELLRFEDQELTYLAGSHLEFVHEVLLLRRKAIQGTLDNANQVYVATRALEQSLLEQRSRLDYLSSIFGNVILYEGAKHGAILATIEEVGK